jgi:HSP20 family molecular chaperone IbpA
VNEVSEMAEESKSLDVKKDEIILPEEQERTRERMAFTPRTDIYETETDIVVMADVPGADENSIDITLEKNVLTINAYVEPSELEGYSLALCEYGVGDYERKFTLSDEIDHDGIQATVGNGVLRLVLPKVGPAKTRKIEVKSD